MDIYVLHDGKEIGPLSPEKTWQLLNQGSILADDLAWSPGMGKWQPLSGILPPAEELPPAPAPAPAAESAFSETATAKQRALLAFLHLGFTRSTTRQEAALLISDALENPAFAVRLAQWPHERLKLHGDLFVAELQARRENRAHHYHTLAQSEGAAMFSGVTRSHAQTVVTHLDLVSPDWEANEATAARDHFFPALAEKFPQLRRPDAPGAAHSSAPQKPSAEAAHPPARKNPRRETSRAPFPLGALFRGLFFGALVVALAWYVMKVLDGGKSPETPAQPSTPAPATPPPVAAPAPAPDPAPPAPMPDAAAPAPTTPTPAPEAVPPPPAAVTPPPSEPAAPAPLVLTKPYAAQMAYGVITLPVGTPLKLLGQEGVLLKVQYLQDTFLVPPSATNHGAQSPPP